MPRRTTILGLAGALLLVLTVSASAAEIPRWSGSWADVRHIWATPQDFREDFAACRPHGTRVAACGTEDGGRTWHPIMREANPRLGGARPLRTSATAGVLGQRTGHRNLDIDHYWTVDAGRHWHRTSTFGRGAERLVGHGRYLYWDVDGRTIYRIAQWPPRRRMTCPEGWRYDLADPDAPPDAWGAVCLNPPAGSGLRSVVARRLQRGFIRDAASIPNGAVWVLAPLERRRPVVLMMRQGRQRMLRLPRGDAPPETTRLIRLEIHAEWPSYINVTATAFGRQANGRPLLLGCVFWESHNGGRSWSTHLEPPGDGYDEPYCNF